MTNVLLDGFKFSVKHEEGSLLQREDRLRDSGEQLRWEQVPNTQEEPCGFLGSVTEIAGRDSVQLSVAALRPAGVTVTEGRLPGVQVDLASTWRKRVQKRYISLSDCLGTSMVVQWLTL